MDMDLLIKKVCKELDTIADKGITSSNLDNAYKLIDIYKDIKEIESMESDSYDARGRKRYDERSGNYSRYNDHKPWDERTERYLTRLIEGMDDYNEGRNRYKDGGSETRMIDGIEMTMNAIINFVESLIDHAETSQEKEIVRKYVNKLKNV